MNKNNISKLDIGVLTEIISSYSGARAPLEIAKHLSDLGHKVTIYAYSYFKNISTVNYLKKNGLSLVILNKPRFTRYFILTKLFKILRKNKHDILYFSGTPPFFIAGLLSGTPIIRMYQGTQFDAYLEKFLPTQNIQILHKLINKIINIPIYWIDFFSYRLSTAVVAISNYAAREGKNLYGRSVFSVIYHGSDLLSLRKRKRRFSSNVELIAVSRLTPYKGFHMLIDALLKTHTKKIWNLTIVGSQPKEKYIKYLKQFGGKRIRILCNVSDNKLATLYLSSDIYVTCDRYLYFGLPVMEAAGFGLPTVAYNFAAAKEVIINNQTGIVADSDNSLIQGLKRLIDNPDERQKMGEAAKRNMQKFTWEICAKRWEQVLHLFAKKQN